jgi:hypothetical protein
VDENPELIIDVWPENVKHALGDIKILSRFGEWTHAAWRHSEEPCDEATHEAESPPSR